MSANHLMDFVYVFFRSNAWYPQSGLFGWSYFHIQCYKIHKNRLSKAAKHDGTQILWSNEIDSSDE